MSHHGSSRLTCIKNVCIVLKNNNNNKTAWAVADLFLLSVRMLWWRPWGHVGNKWSLKMNICSWRTESANSTSSKDLRNVSVCAQIAVPSILSIRNHKINGWMKFAWTFTHSLTFISSLRHVSFVNVFVSPCVFFIQPAGWLPPSNHDCL